MRGKFSCNSSLAVAYACKELNVSATVVLPETSNPRVREMLRGFNSEVIVHGKVWDEADQLARKLATEPGTAYVPPFDDPLLWTGHASLIKVRHPFTWRNWSRTALSQLLFSVQLVVVVF